MSMATVITTVSNKKIPIQEDKSKQDYVDNICPVDNTKGLKITVVTLRNHVLEKYWDIIEKNGFYFCTAKEYPIVYFNNSGSYYFSMQDVKSRVSY